MTSTLTNISFQLRTEKEQKPKTKTKRRSSLSADFVVPLPRREIDILLFFLSATFFSCHFIFIPRLFFLYQRFLYNYIRLLSFIRHFFIISEYSEPVGNGKRRQAFYIFLSNGNMPHVIWTTLSLKSPW